MGRLEVVRGDLSRRHMRLLCGAVHGYANRIFGPTEGIAALPAAVGQAGLGKGPASKELTAKASRFATALRMFADTQLGPSGWIVVIGGRLGFAMRYSKGASVILRATSAQEHQPAAASRSCIVIVYRPPSAFTDSPRHLQQQRLERLLTNSQSSGPTASVASETSDTTTPLTTHQNQNAEDVEADTPFETDHLGQLSRPQSPVTSELKTENEIRLTERLFRLHSFHVADPTSRTTGVDPQENPTCPNGRPLSHRNTLNEVFRRLAQNPAFRHAMQDTQFCAQTLREELTLAAGPLWHVYVSQDPAIVDMGTTPWVSFEATCEPGQLRSSTERNVLMKVPQFRIIAFQLWGTKHPPTFWERLTTAGPYTAACVLCLFWMLKSRVCDQARTLTPLQTAIASKCVLRHVCPMLFPSEFVTTAASKQPRYYYFVLFF